MLTPSHLVPDCERCAALCCVAPAFARSADFAFDKAPGTPCRHLDGGHRCHIHRELRDRGMVGCAVFDCFGAGQRVVQSTFGGSDWRSRPELSLSMFAVFGVMRALHHGLWLVEHALHLGGDDRLTGQLETARTRLAELAAGTPSQILAIDLSGELGQVDGLLRRLSAHLRGEGPALGRADLAGQDLRMRDLRAADLRGALLIGADLRGANLALADLTGADLRGARLDAADLSRSLFVSQAQLDAARGDDATRVPPHTRHPAHWYPRDPEVAR